jgi:hypothetical protein
MTAQSASDVENIVEVELAGIAQQELIELIARLRVPARCEHRPWNYGKEGETYPLLGPA